MEKKKNFIIRGWKGEEKLWKVFWLYGFLLCPLLSLIGILLFSVCLALKHNGDIQFFYHYLSNESCLSYMSDIASLILLPVTILWTTVATWRCAPNCTYAFFKYIARLITILGIMSCILILTLIAHSLKAHSDQNKNIQHYKSFDIEDMIKFYDKER